MSLSPSIKHPLIRPLVSLSCLCSISISTSGFTPPSITVPPAITSFALVGFFSPQSSLCVLHTVWICKCVSVCVRMLVCVCVVFCVARATRDKGKIVFLDLNTVIVLGTWRTPSAARARRLVRTHAHTHTHTHTQGETNGQTEQVLWPQERIISNLPQLRRGPGKWVLQYYYYDENNLCVVRSRLPSMFVLPIPAMRDRSGGREG